MSSLNKRITNLETGPLSTNEQYGWHASVPQTESRVSLPWQARMPFSSVATTGHLRDFEIPLDAGNYDITNFCYVVPVAGYYQVGFNLEVYPIAGASGTPRVSVSIKRDRAGDFTTILATLSITPANDTTYTKGGNECLNTVAYFDVGDSIFVLGTSTDELSYGRDSYFYGILLSTGKTITPTTDLAVANLTSSSSTITGDLISNGNATLNGNTSIANISSIASYDNEIYIRSIAMAKVNDNGANEKVANCTVTRTDVGRYTLTLNKARPTSKYVISLTLAEDSVTRDDVIIQVVRGAVLPGYFEYFIHEQDNATTEGTYKDAPHFVLVSDFD
jgi:hypothetical protein